MISRHYKQKYPLLTDRNSEKILDPKIDTDATTIQEFVDQYIDYLTDIGYATYNVSEKYLGDDYVRIIDKGQIEVGSWIKKEIKNYKLKMASQGSRWWPYYWNEEEAYKPIKFIEKHLYIDSRGTPTVMQPNQHFRIGQIFGWRDEQGNAVINNYTTLMGRSNFKTHEILQLEVFKMIEGDNLNYRGMFAAGIGDATKQLFGNVRKIIRNSSPAIQARLRADTQTYVESTELFNESGRTVDFRVAPLTEESSHGLDLTDVNVDELHTLSKGQRSAVSNLTRSQMKVQSPLRTTASTRSIKLSKPLEEHIADSKNAVNNPRQFETLRHLNFIYEFDSPTQVKSFKNWIITNPNIHLNKNILELIAEYKQAAKSPRKLESKIFFTTQFNILDLTETDAYITQADIERNNEFWDEYINELGNKPKAFIGIDLAKIDDFSYVIVVVPKIINGQNKLFIKGKAFITRTNYETKRKQDNFPDIDDWVASGTLVITNDYNINTTDLDAYINELLIDYDVQGIGYDSALATEFVHRWRETRYGELLDRVSQQSRHTNEALQEIKTLFINGGVVYDRDSLLTYFYRNAELDKGTDKNPVWTVIKSTSKGGNTNDAKIDGVDAFAIAVTTMLRKGGFGEVAKPKRKGVSLNKLYKK